MTERDIAAVREIVQAMTRGQLGREDRADLEQEVLLAVLPVWGGLRDPSAYVRQVVVSKITLFMPRIQAVPLHHAESVPDNTQNTREQSIPAVWDDFVNELSPRDASVAWGILLETSEDDSAELVGLSVRQLRRVRRQIYNRFKAYLENH